MVTLGLLLKHNSALLSCTPTLQCCSDEGQLSSAAYKAHPTSPTKLRKTTRTWLPPVMTTVLLPYLAPPASWPVLYRGGALGALVEAAAHGRTPCWHLHNCRAPHNCQRHNTTIPTSKLFLLQRSAKRPAGTGTPACYSLTDCLSARQHAPQAFHW